MLTTLFFQKAAEAERPDEKLIAAVYLISFMRKVLIRHQILQSIRLRYHEIYQKTKDA